MGKSMPESLDSDQPVSARSGGPRTEAGKAKSSLNALKHGGCSKQLIVAGERQEDYDALRERWFSSYDAAQAGQSLLEEAVLNEWLLWRAQRNFLAIDARLAESDPNDWTAEQMDRLHLMQRYKTGAERSFHRSVAALERFRRTRVYEALAQERAEERVVDRKRRKRAEEEDEEPEMTAQEKFEAMPKLRKAPAVTQWVTVRVVDEKTVTTVKPSNEELFEQSRAMEPPPERVHRVVSIQPWLVEEYRWAADLPGSSNCREQVMTFEEWVRLTGREKERDGGPVGPAELDAEWLSWWSSAYGDGNDSEERTNGAKQAWHAEAETAHDAVQKGSGSEDERGTEAGPGAVGGGANSQREDGDGTDPAER